MNDTQPSAASGSSDMNMDALALRLTGTTLDRNGDILMTVQNRQFLVASKILIFVSPVFRAMLESGFSEGTAARSSETPLEVELQDDDPEALEFILKTLHFQSIKAEDHPSVDQLVSIAEVCDKYILFGAMESCLFQWVKSAMKDMTLANLRKLTKVTFLTGHGGQFSKVTRELILQMPHGQWQDAHEIGLPYAVQGTPQ